MNTAWKFLGENGRPYHGGYGTWHLPNTDGPGDWMPEIEGMLVPCQNGYHLCRDEDLIAWPAPTLYEAEYEGEMIADTNKIVVRRARLLRSVESWNERTMRLWACDCAERVVHLANDQRCVDAIAVARRYANGEASDSELRAAGAAAWAAAWEAARAAAGEAAWEVQWGAARAAAGEAARGAARAAARGAAGGAAGEAAGEAAWDAEKTWQRERLLQYIRGEA